LTLSVCIAGLLPLALAVGAASSITEMTPPIRGLALTNLRDTFEEIHNGQRHEAIRNLTAGTGSWVSGQAGHPAPQI